MGFGDDWLLQRLLLLIPLVLSLSIHEWAHAWSAYQLGDDTAARNDRLTLNPLEHMDPVGTLLLPLLGIPFGWAKPVPINPARFRRGLSMNTGLVLTAAAGPLANVVLALASAAALGILVSLGIGPEAGGAAPWRLLQVLVTLNLLLAFFNLLPIPPLDGSRIVDGLLPNRLRPAWDSFAAYSPFVLGGVLLLPLLAGLMSPLAWPLAFAESLLAAVVDAFAG